MKELIEKLEAATEGGRLLDFEIQVAIEDRIWPSRRMNGTIINPNAKMSDFLEACRDVIDADDEDYDFPRYTTSLDAALTLVPHPSGGSSPATTFGIEGCADDRPRGASAWVSYFSGMTGGPVGEPSRGRGATLALSLCIAALKARNTK